MYQKTVEREECYSPKQLARIKAVLKKIDRAREDPEVLKAARQMIMESTGADA